jgi:predicted metal-dependent phosphotriesterase family hydrolase
MTVKGSISPEAAGFTLCHEHLLCDLWPLFPSYNNILDDENLAIQELRLYKEAGGTTLVDCTSIGLGRNPEALRRISEATGVNIIMGTGWYREEVYPTRVFEQSTNELAAFMVREIQEGADQTRVCAGMIGEIGTERYHITPAQERVFRASARAQRQTGVSVWTHTTHFGELALEQIELLREEGVPADRIVISHLGDRFQSDRFEAIANQGVYLGIDNIGYAGEGYPGDDVRAHNILRLIAAGHLEQIMLSLDICTKSHLRAYGGKGYAYLQQKFLPRLTALGVTAEQVYFMTELNPRRALSFEFQGHIP